MTDIRPERSFGRFSQGSQLCQAIQALWEENRTQPAGRGDLVQSNIGALMAEYDLAREEWFYWCRKAREIRPTTDSFTYSLEWPYLRSLSCTVVLDPLDRIVYAYSRPQEDAPSVAMREHRHLSLFTVPWNTAPIALENWLRQYWCTLEGLADCYQENPKGRPGGPGIWHPDSGVGLLALRQLLVFHPIARYEDPAPWLSRADLVRVSEHGLEEAIRQLVERVWRREGVMLHPEDALYQLRVLGLDG